MLAIALGLASGLSWGVGDFFGGLASRRAPAIAVVAYSQAAGLVVALLALAVARPEAPSAAGWALGLAAGVSGVVGLAAFYRALAVGTMSLVAPISALGALLPLAIDLAAGRSPGPVALVGMVVALLGAALASIAPGPASRRGLGLAVVAAVGFGGFFVLLAESADDAGALWSHHLRPVRVGAGRPDRGRRRRRRRGRAATGDPAGGRGPGSSTSPPT